MNLNLLLLKLSIQKNQILLWESFTDIYLWTLLNYLNYLNKLLENISKEQKSAFLLGDFNVNLLNYNEHNQTNEFLDSLVSNSFIPLILQPTKITTGLQKLCARSGAGAYRAPKLIEEPKILGTLLRYVFSYCFLDTSLPYYLPLFLCN